MSCQHTTHAVQSVHDKVILFTAERIPALLMLGDQINFITGNGSNDVSAVECT
jgi:hypothetical protein